MSKPKYNMNVDKNNLENYIGSMGMGRTTPGSPAGLITLRLPYSTSIPISGHVAMACPFSFVRRSIKAHLRRYDCVCPACVRFVRGAVQASPCLVSGPC